MIARARNGFCGSAEESGITKGMGWESNERLGRVEKQGLEEWWLMID